MRSPPFVCRASLLALVLSALAPALRGAEFDEAKLALIRPRLQKFVEEQQIAGAVTVVGTAKGVVALDAVGNLRLDPKEPMPKDALFRIASMTKPITVAGIVRPRRRFRNAKLGRSEARPVHDPAHSARQPG